MAGDAELSHEEDVERSVERRGDLERHRNAASRQPEDEHVVAARVRTELLRKDSAGLAPVSETLHAGILAHGTSTCFPRRRAGTRRGVRLNPHTVATVLVDARNVLRSEWPNIPEQRVVDLCRQWAAEKGVRALVVFDGAAPVTAEDVVGTGAESADDWIARHAPEHAPYWLVTSDRELRERAGAAAARVVGGGTFARELTR